MGKKNKLQHFEENATFPHLFQVSYQELLSGFHLRGRWSSDFFHNHNPIVVELGCGKGEYTVGLARKYPDKNFIGIDRKGARIWRGSKTSLEDGIRNVAFLRANVELLTCIFGPGEVDEIWITFPDPHPKPKSAARRLTSPVFFEKYREVIRPEGIIHLKTDNYSLFDYTLGVINSNKDKLIYAVADLYNSGFDDDASGITTHYEQIFLKTQGRICYLKCALQKTDYFPDIGEPSFFDKVYQVVRLIPFGKVTSYGAIAQYLGSRGSARMVGYAMNASHSSPQPVPAHRVVNRNGLLTGKHHFGSPALMAQLLINEGVMVENDKILRFRDHFWDPCIELE